MGEYAPDNLDWKKLMDLAAPTIPGYREGDQEILEDDDTFAFDAEADSEPVLLETVYRGNDDEAVEKENLSSDDLFAVACADEPPFPPPLVQPRDPAITGKPIPWILGIRFGHSGITYRIHATLPEVKAGEPLLLETKDGDAVGWVINALPREAGREYSAPYPGKILGIRRRLSQWERDNLRQNQEKERQAKQICWRLIDELKLEMRVSRVEFALDGNKAIVYFTAENRVDFRELVKILAKEVRARVELRQIGVRDETRLLGGMGPCGKVFCCALFLTEFRPVSVRMAKNQDLSLNPESISGLCGRLMCCLSYENDAYLELRKSLPKINSRFLNKEGLEVVVRGVHPMTGGLDVLLPTGDRVRVTLEELTPLTGVPTPPLPVEAPAQKAAVIEVRRPVRGSQPQPAVEPPPYGEEPSPVTAPPAPASPGRRPEGRPRRPPLRRPPEGPRPPQPVAQAPAAPPALALDKPEGEEVAGARTLNRRRRFRRRPSGGQSGGPPAAS